MQINRALFFASLLLVNTANGQHVGPITPRELVEIQDLSAPAASPNGAYVVVRLDRQDIEANKVRMSWYAVPLNSPGEARMIADAGEPDWGNNGDLKSQTPLWSSDSRWIYYRALHDQEMQVWRSSIDGSHTEQLTHDEANVEQIRLDATGKQLFYVVGATRREIIAAEQSEYDNGVLLDESIIPQYPIARTFPVYGRLSMYRMVNGNENGRARSTLLGDRPKYTKVVELSSGIVRRASEDETAEYEAQVTGNQLAWDGSPLRLSAPNGRGAVLLRQASAPLSANPPLASWSGDAVLTWVPGAHGTKAISCTDPLGSGESGRLRLVGWHGDHAVIFANEDLTGQGYYLWTITTNEVQRLAFTEGILGTDRRGLGVCPITDNELLCVTGAAAQLPRLEAFSIQTGKSRILFNPNSAMEGRIGVGERLVIKDKLGDEAPAFLILPRNRVNGQRLPLVITTYACGGFLRGGTGDDVPEHILAINGIASVCLDDTPSGAKLNPNRYESSSLALREALVAQLESRGLIDPRRVGVTGLSFGATQTLFAISHSDAFAVALITSQGYSDPIWTYFLAAMDRVYKRDSSGTVLPNSASYWKGISPALNAERIHAPLLMLLSDREYLAQMQLYFAMRAHGRPVELVVYPDEYHIKNQPRHRLSVYERSIAWLRFWLQGYEDVSKSNGPQYARWRRMRDSLIHAARSVSQ